MNDSLKRTLALVVLGAVVWGGWYGWQSWKTRQALEAVERREGLHHAKDAADLFRQLGI